MAKQSKNLQNVQDMLDDNFQRKLQVGAYSVGSNDSNDGHKVGDTWTDSDGKEWVQKQGYRTNITKFSNKGIAEQCSDCNTYITKKWDKEVYKFNNRCYYCQINFESEMKSFNINHDTDREDQGKKYTEWKEAQDKRIKEGYIEKFEEENKELIKEIEKMDNPFDMTVANALANGEVEMTINKNKAK